MKPRSPKLAFLVLPAPLLLAAGRPLLAQEPPQPNAPITPVDPVTVPGSISLSQGSKVAGGQFTLGSDVVAFTANEGSTDHVSVQLTLHGVTLTAEIDFINQTAHFDGYATANGLPTALTSQDLASLAAFSAKLQAKVPTFPSRVAEALIKAVGLWEQWSTDSPLTQDT